MPSARGLISRTARDRCAAASGCLSFPAPIPYFTFFATAEEGLVQTTGDWLVAAWSAALALAFLVAAVRLGRDRWVVPLLVAALCWTPRSVW